ncbi:MAG: ribonuclease III family protein [Solirubrobacterales bacterium]
MSRLRDLIDALPEELRARAVTHSSWVPERVDSYGRLAFLGDSVLGLAVAEHLYRENPGADIGRLTKIHGQAVSGRACAAVALELALPELMREGGSSGVDGGIDVESLLASERALASICEAVIGACYLQHGHEATAEATIAAFSEQIVLASYELLDYKSALQERLARDGATVSYAVTGESGPPHDRRFDVDALAGGAVIGKGSGRSKKTAEQEAAARAIERLDP